MEPSTSPPALDGLFFFVILVPCVTSIWWIPLSNPDLVWFFVGIVVLRVPSLCACIDVMTYHQPKRMVSRNALHHGTGSSAVARVWSNEMLAGVFVRLQIIVCVCVRCLRVVCCRLVAVIVCYRC